MRDDIRKIVAATDSGLVKVIVECGLFDDAVKRNLAAIVAESGADYVKTSTGFAATGATLEDVSLLSRAVAGKDRCQGVRWYSRHGRPARRCCLPGATRIGTSAGMKIMQQWRNSVDLK